MQRWMEAKMQLARRHGRTISKAGLMGDVREDRAIGYVEPKILPEPQPNNARHVCRKRNRAPSRSLYQF
jgi:hypothetical protein